jgi:hypothetical protein
MPIFFLKKNKVPDGILTQNSIGAGISYTDPRKRRFWNTVPGCTLHSKKFGNGVPPQKYPFVSNTNAHLSNT